MKKQTQTGAFDKAVILSEAKDPVRDSSAFGLRMTVILSTFTFAVVILLAVPGVLFAQAAGPLGPIGTPLPADQIGVVAAVKGSVQITDSGAVGRVVESGAPVRLGDTISTDEKGQLQILLRDQTIFTIGPNSSIIIDEFVYDPSTEDGKVTAEILKGTFRFITGKIAAKKPENMNVRLPVGSIGVRGTIVAGSVQGTQSMAVLLGPGPNNQIGAPAGSFILNNAVNNEVQSTHVTQINFGSEIEGANIPPVPAYRVPDNIIESITNAFSSTAPPEGGTPGTPGAPTGPGGPHPGMSPEAMIEMARNMGISIDQLPVGEVPDFVHGPFPELPHDIAQLIHELQAQAPPIASTFEELRSLNDGAFHFENFGSDNLLAAPGIPTTRSGVTFNFEANINFSTDVFGGSGGTGSKITSATTDIGSFEFVLSSGCPTCNYNPTAFSGSAGFFYSEVANGLGGACATCVANVSIGLANTSPEVEPGAGVQNIAVKAVLLDVTIKDGPGGNILAQIAQPGTLAERESGVADGSPT